MHSLLETLVIVFCFVGALIVFIVSFTAEESDEREKYQRLHPRGK